MTSKKSKTQIEIPSELSGIFQKHYDAVLADSALTDLDVILISIYLIEYSNKKAGAKYDDVRDLFVNLGRRDRNFTANISRAQNKDIIKLTEDRNIQFLSNGLKRLRELLGQVGKSPVYVIRSGENFTGIKLFEEFLNVQVNDEDVLLCDPYIGPQTLFPFSTLKDKIRSLKILTANVYEADKFEDYRKRLSKELDIPIEYKVNKKLHDRFIIFGDNCWSIGASIKDLGNKNTTIREIGEVVSSMKDLFTERWNES